MRFRASSSAVDLSFLVDLFRPVPWVPMFPQKHHKLDLFILKSHSRGPTAHRIIQTERLASYWLSCVAKMLRVKDEKKTNRVRSRAQRASLSYIRFGFFLLFFLCFCKGARADYPRALLVRLRANSVRAVHCPLHGVRLNRVRSRLSFCGNKPNTDI